MSQRHFRSLWHHEFPDEPVVILSEIDSDNLETRKIEIFADGSKGYASRTEEYGPTGLGLERIPPLKDINSDPQFSADWITPQEFESEWKRRNEKVAGIDFR